MLVSLDDLPTEVDARSGPPHEPDVDEQRALERLLGLIHRLRPPDRQVILLWLEGVDAAGIGEVTGLSAGNVATKVHRIKRLLSERFHEGGRHGQ
jgi:RNA polymerase sigma-70 factor, ECF subfamily